MRLVGAAIVVMLFAGETLAGKIELRSSRPCAGVIDLEPVCDGTKCKEPVRLEFVSPSHLSVPPGSWRASFGGDACWAPPLRIEEPTARIDLVGFLTVSGTVVAERDLPDRLSSAIRTGTATEWISNPGACLRSKTQWMCQVPSSARDLRLDLQGFSSAYYWDLSLLAERTELDSRTVAPGASIIGTVGKSRGLAPETVEVTAQDNARPSVRFRTNATSRGFFQITGLPPASYRVFAKAKKTSSQRVNVDAGAEREYSVMDDLHLRELGSLQLVVNPAPGDVRWTVRVQRPDTLNSEILTTVTRGELDETGTWTAEGLDFGPHVISILDEKSEIIHREDVDVADGRSMLSITLDQVPIRGRLSIGSDALEATVQFSMAGARVELIADEDGQFSGMLPREGKWQVQVTPAKGLQRIRTATAIEIRKNPEQAYARVDIELPSGKVNGLVVDGSGKPIPDAEIIVWRGNKIAANAASGADGIFNVFGLDAGVVQLKALVGEQESAHVSYQVSDEPADATLVVQENVNVRGHVITERGQPIPGAVLRYLMGVEGAREEVTGPSGEFTLRVPNGATVDVAVLAPGFPAKLQRLLVTKDAAPVFRLSTVPSHLIVRLKGAPPWPYVVANHAAIPLPALFRPHAGGGMPAEASPEGFVLEVDPGEYALCGDASRANCIPKTLPPAARITIDASTLWRR